VDRIKDEAKKAVQELPEHHGGAVNCIAFTSDGSLCATGGDDYAIRLWQTNDRKLLHAVTSAHRAAVTSLQFTPSGQLVSAGRDGQLKVWDVSNPQSPKVTLALPARSGDVPVLGVSPDGRTTLFDHGPELRMVSLANRQIEGAVRNPSGALSFSTMALFSPDGKTILTNNAAEGRVQLWRTPARPDDATAADGLPREVKAHAAELRQFVWNNGAATCGAFAPDGSFAVTGTHDNQVLVWAMPPKGDDGELLERPRAARLTYVDESLDTSARQVRVWAEVDNPEARPNAAHPEQALTPGGTATLVVPLSRGK
jgi:WD40 repeat protein